MLETFLNKKPLYYDVIDYTRMPRIYETLKTKIALPKIIHLIGTNGKGTTGRFLATALHSMGYSVGHYTSPHILEFNERIWLNGENATTELLNTTHKSLLSLLTSEDAEALSYFEYTTLLAVLLYEKCDYIVLEAGLGGEYDATAVFENILTLVTPIDKDHEAFLGTTIKEIASTKLNAVQTKAILAKQPNADVYEVAQKIAEKKDISIESYDNYLDTNDIKAVESIAKKLQLSTYLQENLSLAIAGVNYLGLKYDEESFNDSRLFGRLSPLGKNILIDVGHNTLAATKIYESLKQKQYVLVYNSYKDKNYREILRILKPLIQHVEIIKVEDIRIESKDILEKTVEGLGLKYRDFEKIETQNNYLVFGSFSVAEAFLKVYHE